MFKRWCGCFDKPKHSEASESENGTELKLNTDLQEPSGMHQRVFY